MDMPIACNLNVFTPAQRERHTVVWQTLEHARLQIEELPDGYAFHLPSDHTLLAAEFISLERLCCPFFNFALEIEAGGAVVKLKLTGSAAVKAFLKANLDSIT